MGADFWFGVGSVVAGVLCFAMLVLSMRGTQGVRLHARLVARLLLAGVFSGSLILGGLLVACGAAADRDLPTPEELREPLPRAPWKEPLPSPRDPAPVAPPPSP